MNFLLPVILSAMQLVVGQGDPLSSDAPAVFYTITIQGAVVAMPKGKALSFVAEHSQGTDGTRSFLDALALVKSGQARSVANSAISTKSG